MNTARQMRSKKTLNFTTPPKEFIEFRWFLMALKCSFVFAREASGRL